MGLVFILPVIFIHDGVMLFLALPMGVLFFAMGVFAVRRARNLPK
jgi:hypothetical protein